MPHHAIAATSKLHMPRDQGPWYALLAACRQQTFNHGDLNATDRYMADLENGRRLRSCAQTPDLMSMDQPVPYRKADEGRARTIEKHLLGTLLAFSAQTQEKASTK
ncbi:uncharacterized protein RSE6_12235 [Rhynchosporium secalis]|uniref:Uncharacterized protein n=1 Tax=Rhynchosporium secalis TaxID=38038 RepID=A0A1E1MPY8_RHYSE|nr:uncharacterized protein RSE6_12235 [Rhynchosporium secalis]